MTSVIRKNRKASDEQIIRLNNVGLSLSTIGKILGLHPTTITLRLHGLGISPADTRRSFMEDIWKELTSAQQDWLVEKLDETGSIKNFVRLLLVEQHANSRSLDQAA